jgi:hypothetical protein
MQLQTAPPAPPISENGAIEIYSGGGFSYGMPANQAIIVGSDGSYAASRPTNLLSAVSVGVGVTAWKSLVPFFDFASYNDGKATASLGSNTATVSGNAVSLNGGLRVNVLGKATRDRWYLQFGGGVVRQNATGALFGSSIATTSSTRSVMYGWGGQQFWGHSHHWGTDVGIDGFHTSAPFSNGKQDFVRLRAGIFYQTKSSTH